MCVRIVYTDSNLYSFPKKNSVLTISLGFLFFFVNAQKNYLSEREREKEINFV